MAPIDRARVFGHDRAMEADPMQALAAEPDADRRWEAVCAFASRDRAVALMAGERDLDSDDPRRREVAAEVLGAILGLDAPPTDEIADLLIPRLEAEDDAAALESVVTALGNTCDDRARAGVVKHADHPDENVRFAVATSLPAFDLDDASMDALRRLSADADDDVRDWATFALAESDATDAATIEALAARTDDPDDDTRAEAILGLARRRDPRARALIDRELSKPVHGSLIEDAHSLLNG